MGKLPKTHRPKKGKHIRIRVRDPKKFQKSSLRTQDIGRKGHSKRIAGKLKKTGKFATQAFLVKKSDEHLVPKFEAQARDLIRRERMKKKRR